MIAISYDHTIDSNLNVVVTDYLWKLRNCWNVLVLRELTEKHGRIFPVKNSGVFSTISDEDGRTADLRNPLRKNHVALWIAGGDSSRFSFQWIYGRKSAQIISNLGAPEGGGRLPTNREDNQETHGSCVPFKSKKQQCWLLLIVE